MDKKDKKGLVVGLAVTCLFVTVLCLTVFNCAFLGLFGDYHYLGRGSFIPGMQHCSVCQDNSWDTSTNKTDCHYYLTLVDIGG